MLNKALCEYQLSHPLNKTTKPFINTATVISHVAGDRSCYY